MPAIHILGASGSGTSTLGRSLAEQLACAWFDTDCIYWEQTDEEYVRLMEEAIESNPDCVISGWLGRSGDVLISRFQLIVWLRTPTELRIRRLKARELANFGERILLGGDMYETHQSFLDYAGQYDDGGMDIRSYARQKEWLERAACPVLELDGCRTTESLAADVLLKQKEIAD